MENKEKVLEVKDLVVSFKTDRGIVHAVRGVSFDLYKGETLCIVGESGSGKSVTNKAIMGISAKNAIIEQGSIMYEGEDLIRVSEEEFHRIRGHKIGMIFQDPLSALNPVMKIGKQITEATMVNNDILKRKYNELIANELTAFRNNEANTNYNISKLKNEININEGYIKNLTELKKNEEKVQKQLANPSLKEEKKVALEASLQENKEKQERISTEIADYVLNFKKQNVASIERYEKRIKKYEALSFEDEIKSQINQNNIAKTKLHLDIIKDPSFVEFDLNDVMSSLKHRNAELSKLLESYKAEFKLCKNALKADLDRKKKEAKAKVDAYHKELIEENKANLDAIAKEKAEYEAELTSLRSTLSEAELKTIDEILDYNKKAKAAYEKAQKKNKEINLSKQIKNDLELKELPNARYAELLAKIEECDVKTEQEKQDFINKTRITKAEAKRMALEVMKEVGIPLPEQRFKQYPFEFSGGMRQRIVIAIALTANPDILICDEPTTALDVTIQAQILDLINKLKEKRNLSCIFITHDLGVVAHMADRVAVMYAGKIVEYGTAQEVFFDPRHPYTWALLSSIPDLNSKEKLDAIPGTPPDMLYPPKGDAFALRSKYAMKVDFEHMPPYFKVTDTHYAATWLLAKEAPKVEMPAIVKTRIETAKKMMEEDAKNEK
ncbi:MAG: ATP-binding cassette domain-containing protein [Bacilli bacterium]|nr:ATP-binding cassette domain-containing protein [Bacilli bacterium]